ncbi:MAG: type II toxin-antitoxin system VapC family toxin [Sulfurospirillum sp.]|nr:type II toxin-antitoxin system VapC family toxin [Sulfurospirillum sp.]
MNTLIDTHIFLWLANDNLELIQSKNLQYLKDRNNNIYMSSLSIAEISIKISIGKLKFDGDILEVLKSMDIEILDFDGKSALELTTLPYHHRDPFDRMIIAQAMTNSYKIMSVDRKFKLYDCELL